MLSLPYGKGSLPIPDIWKGREKVLHAGPFPRPDPEATVIQALDNPVGGLSLEDLCGPGDRVAVVVPDLTRRAAVRVYLPILLERLSRAGVGPGDVRIIVALGIHRSLTDEEIKELVGEEVAATYSVSNHDADDEQSCVRLGVTDAGIPVEVSGSVSDARCVILTGNITYHYFAGYGGGRKLLLPGVASRRSCEAHHRLVVSWRRGELRGALAPGLLEGNPVHDQMVQACRFLERLFTINVITDPDSRIIACTAGELEAAHMEACLMYDRWFRRVLDAPARLVMAGAGGYPRDINFVQAHKGLYAAHEAVDTDGVVILAAESAEGPGHSDLLGWFDRCRSEREWLEQLQARYQINGQTAFSTWLRVRSVPTILVSRLRKTDVERMGMVPAEDVEEALEKAGLILGDLPPPVIIPDAGDVLPVVENRRSKG